MGNKKGGRHIASIVYDLEREDYISKKILKRNKAKKIEKLRNIDAKKVAEDIIKMIERSE